MNIFLWCQALMCERGLHVFFVVQGAGGPSVAPGVVQGEHK